MEYNMIFDFLNTVPVQITVLSREPFGRTDPLVKEMIPSVMDTMGHKLNCLDQ